MASETKGQLVVFTCDECGHEEGKAGSWKEVWEALKEDGWRARKDGNAWIHLCPECTR